MRQVGPYDHTPQKPERGAVLPYFGAKEGLQALAGDPALQTGAAPVTRNTLPPARPVQAASAGGEKRMLRSSHDLYGLRLCKYWSCFNKPQLKTTVR